jgi:predicted GNAT superfamily acetyltransferase
MNHVDTLRLDIEIKLVPLHELDSGHTLALNNLHALELSRLNRAGLEKLVAMSYYAFGVAPALAFLIAIDCGAAYDNHNFRWLSARLSNFVYVDRVVVDSTARRSGIAQALYQGLFERAKADNKSAVVCEVNVYPPNRASHSFHRKLGFESIGEGVIPSGKRVEYLLKSL